MLDEIADFVRATPALPPPFIGLKVPTPALFWREMPQQIVDQIMRRVPYIRPKKPKHGPALPEHPDFPRVILETIDAWQRQIGEVYAAWLAAGKPPDSRVWYMRHVSRGRPGPLVVVTAPPPAAPPPPDFLASLPPAMAELLNPDRPYENYHPGFQPSREGPIRAYGAQIWPRPAGARWTFREAFYAWHLWHELQPLMMREERPRERARFLMNPFQVIIANLSGGAAAALSDILTAQFHHPERSSDTAAPPKRLNFQD